MRLSNRAFVNPATREKTTPASFAGVISANGTAEDPRAYGEEVAHRFFLFSLAANTPVRLGTGKDSVTSKPSKTFPYVPAASESRVAGA